MRKIQGRIAIRLIAGIAALIPFALVPQLALAQAPGSLAQLTSPNSCIETGTTNGCPATGATGLNAAHDVAVSPDGKNVYVIGNTDDAIAEFSRNADGSLTQLAGPNDCIADSTAVDATTCIDNATATGLVSPLAILVSPDGQNVYVAAQDSHGVGTVAEFARNPDGSLTQLGSPNDCLAENIQITDTTSGCGNQSGHGIQQPVGLAVSPDGKDLYVADSGENAVAVLTRNTTTGALSQPGVAGDCTAESTTNGDCSKSGRGLTNTHAVVVSPDGNSVYTASNLDPATIAEFSRAADGSLTQLADPNECIQEVTATPECSNDSGHGLLSITSLAVSPDGKNLYSSSAGTGGAIAEFARNADGSLTQLGNGNNCIEENNSQTDCDDNNGNGLSGALSVKVSPDGADVYVATFADDCCNSDVAEFARNSADGSLTQLPSPDNCIEQAGSDCGSNGIGLGGGGLAISPDGASLYATGTDDIAAFSRTPVLHTLTVSTQGPGAGSVSDGANQIACPSRCSHSYTANTPVTLISTPMSGSTFTGWSGACSGAGTCQLTMGADMSVTATFTSNPGSPTPVLTSAPSAVTDAGAGFSGSVNPEGLATTAYFQYGLDQRYSQVGASGPNYTGQTQPQMVGSDFTSDAVGPVTVTGLVPQRALSRAAGGDQ